MAVLSEAMIAVRDAAHVLIVDDSAVARAVIARMIDASDTHMVVGAVANADAALAFLQHTRVDFILLDIEMPGIDGLTALPDLLGAGRGAKIVVVSSSANDGGAATVQAFALGAADTLVKPGTGALGGRFAEALLDKLARLDDRAIIPATTHVLYDEAPPRAGSIGDAYDIVAIGASTGGIHALSHLLRAIPPSFRLPILITQHLPASFMPYFAAQLAVLAGRPCEVAVDLMRIRPGRIIVAAGDSHMRCVDIGDGGSAIRLSTAPSMSGCMPSVDPMFESVAAVFGARALGVVLSGMGRDGADGAKRIADAGGCVVVQDRSSSVIWGMPGAALAGGAASAVLPPDAIGKLIAERRRPSC